MNAPEIVVHAESVDGVAPVAEKTVWECDECLRVDKKWSCRCPSCGSYNSMIEKAETSVQMKPLRAGVPQYETRLVTSHGQQMVVPGSPSDPRMDHAEPKVLPAGLAQGKLVKIGDMSAEDLGRVLTGEEQLDFLLGGGMATPSVFMIGGDPGVGKSTLLTQVFGHVGNLFPAVYGCGEESYKSVALRLHRLGIITPQNKDNCQLIQGTDYDEFEQSLLSIGAKFAVLDSLQTFRTTKDENGLPMPPGVRVGTTRMTVAIAERYHKFCHAHGIMGWIVCHVTKEGDFAGPQTVMHAVDVNVLLTAMADGNIGGTSTKNRFGATDVAGIFRMQESGLRSIE